CMQALQSPFTV
nr:immunoglobulin light chain junction region [Macaca mulatta]